MSNILRSPWAAWPLAWALLLSPTTALADGGFSLAKSVTRFQVRHSTGPENLLGSTLSSFLLARNGTFLLLIADYQEDRDQDTENGCIEANVGRSFGGTPVGWIVRGRSYYKDDSVAAAGLQLNFNSVPAFRAPLKRARLKSFVQLLGKTEDPYFGDREILLYYNIGLVPKRFAVRGYDVFYDEKDNSGVVRNAWFDAIFSVNSRFDVYYRLNYVSEDNGYLGPEGTTRYLGFRINWF